MAITLHVAGSAGFGQRFLNDSYDALVRRDFVLSLRRSMKENLPPVSSHLTIVAFDQETYAASHTLGFWTPRDLLGQCLVRAVELGARVVVVDFAVSRPVPVPCRDGLCLDENSIFLNRLRIAASLARDTKAVIVLPWLDATAHAWEGHFERFTALCREYPDVIKLGSSAAFSDPVDGKVRHFLFFDSSVGGLAQPVFSFPVLAAVYFWHGPMAGDRLLAAAGQSVAKGQGAIAIPGPAGGRPRELLLRRHDPYGGTLASRYVFRLAPREIAAGLGGQVEDPLLKFPSLFATPATLLAASSRAGKIFADKVVLIGSTYPELGDVHNTPLGNMPGVFLVANGLNQMLEGLSFHELPLGWRIVIEATIIVTTAFAFLYLPTWLAAALPLGVVYAISTPLSLLLFRRWGLFLDFWLLVLAISIQNQVVKLEQAVEAWLVKRREGVK